MMKHCQPLLICLLLGVSTTLNAKVVHVAITKRSDLAKTSYEEIIGKLHFEIDPILPANAIIADIELAPLTKNRQVAFSSDFRLLKPKDSTQSNGAAWVEIPNRGGKAGLPAWAAEQGFTLLNVGWEFDIPTEKDKLSLQAPSAVNPDGSPVRGVVSTTFTPDKESKSQTLTDLPNYPPVDINGADSKLIVRSDPAYPGGEEIPRSQWELRDQRLHLQGGFKAGLTYEVFYLSEAPPIAGLGYAAIRDAVSWLKYSADSPAPVKQAYAFGSSQCGRFLRDLLYLGFNTDETNQQALDGVIAHIAGAGRLVLNQRWSKPRGLANFDTTSYPFADAAHLDPVSGQSEGVQDNSRIKHPPKVFYINTSAEYWGAGRVAALTHTDPAGSKDIELPAHVRSYFFAGTQHGASAFPPTPHDSLPFSNPVNTNAVVTALRMAMHHWVSAGTEPPASRYPTFSDQTLVQASQISFPEIPGMNSPNKLKGGPRLPNPLLPAGAGTGSELPLLVSQVDADGNELAGIRLPDVAVPLGTATGWVFRSPAMGSPDQLVFLRGAWLPFAKTKAARQAANDPRPSLEERYSSKEAYLDAVQKVLQDLIRDRLLTEPDLPQLMEQASERWDWVMSQ